MLASLLSDVSLIIGALAGLIIAAAVLWLVVRQGFKKVHVQMGGITTTLEAVNKAVNNVPANEATLVDRVRGMEARQRTMQTNVNMIARHVGCPVEEETTS